MELHLLLHLGGKVMEEKKIGTNEVLNVSFAVVVTPEDIDDIMCTALEGGITYWCNRAKVVGDYLGEYGHEQIARGGELKMHVVEPFDEEDTEWYTLSKEKFMNGLEMYLKTQNGGKILDIVDDKLTLDTSCVDANVADYIVQYALFREEIYG